jgi:acetyl-CoA carboxylase carboxyl transferase beta subunit
VYHVVDEGSFVPRRDDLSSPDPLGFPAYPDALARARATSASDESVVCGAAAVSGQQVEVAAFDFSFIGGSMGEVAGERLARALERAARRSVPLVLYTSTGGARMQEGMRALAQLPKLVAARLTLSRAHQPLIAVLGNPTTGGVLAGLGALADVTLAEERATIGFAGPRIAQRFTGRALPPDSHTAESALSHGLVDAVLPRRAVRRHVGHCLSVLRPDDPGSHAPPPPPEETRRDAWGALQSVRSPARLAGHALLGAVAERHLVLRGDRAGEDDHGLIAALGRVSGLRALLLALDRDAAPGPSAFRKARRCLEIARRLDIPVVTFIDTPGADLSQSAEARGIAWAVAELMEAMMSVPVPTLAVVTGEGGSGGALALGCADTLLACVDATFSVIAPEAAAEILWRDPRRAPEAARVLRIAAPELIRLGIADALLEGPPSPEGLRAAVAHHLWRLGRIGGSPGERIARRHARWRAHG